MKKLVFVFVFVFASLHAFAGNQTRLTGLWATQIEEIPRIEAFSADSFLHFGGIGVEYVTRNFGFGASTAVSFHEHSSDFWNIKLDTQIFISYHILDNQQVFDPFLLAGVGAKLDIDVKSTDTIKGHQRKYGKRSVTRRGVSLYPYIGAGLGLNFKNGVYLSSRFHWKPHFIKVPVFGYPRADERPYELIVSVGYSFNRNS